MQKFSIHALIPDPGHQVPWSNATRTQGIGSWTMHQGTWCHDPGTRIQCKQNLGYCTMIHDPGTRGQIDPWSRVPGDRCIRSRMIRASGSRQYGPWSRHRSSSAAAAQHHEPWSWVPGSRYQDPGTRVQDPGSMVHDPGSRMAVHAPPTPFLRSPFVDG